jgi:hypothetical protein
VRPYEPKGFYTMTPKNATNAATTASAHVYNLAVLEAIESMERDQLANVLSLNKKGAYVRNLGRVYRPDLSEKTGIDCFSKVADFQNECANLPKVAESITEQRGKIKVTKIDAGKAWLTHPDRLTYDAIIFNPLKTGDYDGLLNKFKGLPYQPKTGATKADFALLDAHIREVIAGGNKEAYEYWYKWLAFVFQNVGKKTGVVPVLKGLQGSGKGIFCNFLGDLIGKRHYQAIATPDKITGKFNSHLESCLLLFADEALFKGDHGAQNAFKALVTEPTLNIERKGLDSHNAPNYMNFIMASNAESVFNLDKGERRYWILQVGEAWAYSNQTTKQSHALRAQYFKELGASLESIEVKQAFLGYLESIDLSDFDVGNYPATDAQQAELLSGLDAMGAWLYDELNESGDFEGEYTGGQLHSRFIGYCDKMKLGAFERKSLTALGLYLKNLGVKSRKTGGLIVRDFADNAKIKELFTTCHGISFND